MTRYDPYANAKTDILVVEDSDTQADQIAHLLSTSGYSVRVARNGREAIAAVKKKRPTLIVSDIAMPEMDGFAMCREIKSDPALQDVPVILLTALTSLYDVIRGLDCGADNFIRKPFEGNYLLGRIRFILANRELRSNERVQLGMQINLGGQTHFVTAERQQIFDLLISTYEEAIQMTEELKEQQERITHSYQSLEGLYKIAEALNPAITEKSVAEMALERALNLPGIIGGCVQLLDADSRVRWTATRHFAADSEVPEICSNCACRQKLLAGELRSPQIIEDCAWLRQCESTRSAERRHVHVSVPLTAGASTLGLMNLLLTDETVLKEEDFQVLETVGNQIAIALERARLYAHMESLVKERTEALQAERNLLSAVVNTTGALVMLVDTDGRIVMFNPACERTLGWKSEEVRNRPYADIFLPPDTAALAKAFFDKKDSSEIPPQVHGEWLARDGSKRYIIWSTTRLKRTDEANEYFLGTGIDVTELKSAEERVRYLSNFDMLTGLPNRILLRDRVKLAQERITTSASVMGLLVVCLGKLPLIRQSLGVKAEQSVLLQAASRLKEWANTESSVARLGDDSFAVVTVRPDSRELSNVARQLLAAIDPPFEHEQQDLHLEAAVGIAVFPNDGDDFDSLLQGAEAAVRRASSGSVERYEFYRPELNRGTSERLRLEGALRRALERNEFVLQYQPQVDMRSGKIIGFEALVRWRHPELGMIPPGRFIGLAEETGLILPIGEWVLRRACEQSREWKRAGLSKTPIAVNLSAKQFSKNIPGTVKEILDETGMDPSLLELELTESLSMEDPENTIGILQKLKEMGIRLSIDDFGTGYSNLSYLKRFPVDKLKLDQSFVHDLISDPDDLSIAHAVIAMAHSLRLRVIAEGVETEGQLALLAKHGCDEIQGFLFSRPVDAALCAAMLRESKSLDLSKFLPRPYQRTLLVVDDEMNIVAAIKRALRGKGFDVLVTTSAAEAFEVLATTEVGVILCDQRMPGMSGTEFLSRVKHMYPAIVRMVLTGYTDLQSVADAVNHGAIFKFLTKPWDDDVLLAALGEAFQEFESRS
ncbi:MAG TPA: EAL domain-containing protein [Paucimonas sp.]|nr:EAL domain-containing protein [Paucimonas sp.]